MEGMVSVLLFVLEKMPILNLVQNFPSSLMKEILQQTTPFQKTAFLSLSVWVKEQTTRKLYKCFAFHKRQLKKLCL